MLININICKRIIFPILPLCLFISSISSAKYSGGSGEISDPYRIANVNDLMVLSADANDYEKAFILDNDIDLAGLTFSNAVVARDRDTSPGGFDGPLFTGVFDGQGHKILNLSIETGQTDNASLGLFGWIGPEGIVKNLGTEDVNIFISVGSPNYSDFVGALCGLNKGTIANCYSTGYVSGDFEVGGLCGSNYNGSIINSFSTAIVKGYDSIGGFCGFIRRGNIVNCYSTGNVIAEYKGGRFAGYCNDANVIFCYTAGTVNDDVESDGLCVNTYNTTFYRCYYLSSTGEDIGFGQPLTDLQMKQQASFQDWDFVGEDYNGDRDIWKICEGANYPKLAWQQKPTGDFVCPDGVDFMDFAVLAYQWMLPPDFPDADIAPPSGDGIIDIRDLAVFFENWLNGIDEFPQEQDYVQNIDVQPCDMHGLLSTLDSTGNRFIITVQGSNLQFYDLITANCCITGIDLDVKVEGNLITIREKEVFEYLCTCICDFPTTALLGPFAPGSYVIEVFDVGNHSLGTYSADIPGL